MQTPRNKRALMYDDGEADLSRAELQLFLGEGFFNGAKTPIKRMEHLACFTPGMLALASTAGQPPAYLPPIHYHQNILPHPRPCS